MKANEFCDKVGVSSQDRFVIEKLYSNLDQSFSDWVKLTSKDFKSVDSKAKEPPTISSKKSTQSSDSDK